MSGILELIMARRAELGDRMALAEHYDATVLAAATADEMAFLVALLRDLRDESYRAEGRMLATTTRERWAREGWTPA